MRFIILGFILYYLYGVCIHGLKVHEVKGLIDEFESTLEKLSFKHPNIERSDFYSVISKKPVLTKYTSLYFREFSYGSDVKDLSKETVDIYHSLHESLNTILYNWRYVLNPFLQLKKILFLPAKLLKDSGLKLSKGQSVLINLFTYLITYFLTMFSEEIKAFILQLLK